MTVHLMSRSYKEIIAGVNVVVLASVLSFFIKFNI